jgi:glycosyltransferase involved in cell wall biosynthesis
VAEPETVSLVIPAFNEENGIAAIVEALRKQARWREILVVDDASTDQTAARAEAAGARVLRHPYNKGNGAAVKTGLRAASGDVVLLMDADGQHDPADAVRLCEPIGVFDMVVGARSARDQTAARAFGNAVFNAFASWLSGRPIADLTSGFRAARRDAMLEILHLLPNGFSYPATSCLAFLKAGLNVTFVPVRAHRRIGKSKLRPLHDGIRFLLIILKIVTLYSPLKVFFPVALSSFAVGAAYGLWNVIAYRKIPMGSALLIQLAVVVFLVGLVSEQIAAAQERK